MAFSIIIRGPLGSGKTTVANALANSIGAKVVSIDRILEDIENEWEGGYETEETFLKTNKYAARSALEAIKEGRNVIFDGCFYWKSQISDLLRKLPGRSYVFTLDLPLQLCVKRDSMRELSYGAEATREVFAKTTRFDYGIKIDASGTLEQTVDKILSALQAEERGPFSGPSPLDHQSRDAHLGNQVGPRCSLQCRL